MAFIHLWAINTLNQYPDNSESGGFLPLNYNERMLDEYDRWLDEVRDALRSMNMAMGRLAKHLRMPRRIWALPMPSG
jgi:hypothetical protein